MDRQTPKTLRKMGGVVDPISLGFILLGLGIFSATTMQSQAPVVNPVPVAMEAPQHAPAAPATNTAQLANE